MPGAYNFSRVVVRMLSRPSTELQRAQGWGVRAGLQGAPSTFQAQASVLPSGPGALAERFTAAPVNRCPPPTFSNLGRKLDDEVRSMEEQWPKLERVA